ncbi:hypothetical protein pb186bvf_018337 [Paramecium bursaria]
MHDQFIFIYNQIIKNKGMNINNLFTNPKEIKYGIKQVERWNSVIFTSQISNNEQYLACGGEDKILKIYDIKLNKFIERIYTRHKILVCQFTFDSSRLYVGCAEGYIFGYDVKDDFERIFSQKVKKDVNNIITIQNQYIITFSRDSTITKIDTKRKKKIFKYRGAPIEVSKGRVGRTLIFKYAFDTMDYNQIDDMIIVGINRSIQYIDSKNRKSFLENDDSHKCDILQIQLINDNQYLLSLDVGSNLFKWKIDYIKKDLIKIQEFRVPSEIQSFYSVNQDQNLLLMCQGYLKLINSNGETIYILYHESREFNIFFDHRQLDNLKYINIRDRNNIYLAIQQN